MSFDSVYPPGSTREAILKALPLLALFTEHQWEFPKKADLKLVDNVLRLNNMTITDGIMTLGMVNINPWMNSNTYTKGESFTHSTS